ncbi:unnamed protein product [Rotaria sordida]|uniref:Cytochrome P450 n=1 Tax=Rotaria sordida TaxID=392033 RepID=A0A815DHS7_9BILA|nr:unnamed protein product [Rotaria sordida]CAF1298483.1 unnamed protein product [Rotaria sordida]
MYRTLVRPQKRFDDIFRNQGVSCEPFVPFIGQLIEIRRAAAKDASMNYRMQLVQKHGYVYVFCFGSLLRLMVMEPDMLVDVFARTHAQKL